MAYGNKAPRCYGLARTLILKHLERAMCLYILSLKLSSTLTFLDSEIFRKNILRHQRVKESNVCQHSASTR